MSTRQKIKSYQAQARINLLVSVEISAENLDEALAKAKRLEETDFVEILGEYISNEGFELTGVYTSA